MSDYRSYDDQEVRDWWDDNYNKAKEGWAKRDDNDKYKFMQTDHGWGVRKQMEEDGWDQMPSKNDPKNKINSIKDLNRINEWFEQGEDEPEEKPKKKKEKPYEPPEPTPEYQQAKQSVAEYKKRLYSGDFLKGKSNGWWEDDDTTESDITTPIEPNVTEQNDTKKSFITKRHAEGFMKGFMEKFRLNKKKTKNKD